MAVQTLLWPYSVQRKWKWSASVCAVLILSANLVSCESPYPGKETRLVIRQMDRDALNEVCREKGLRESANGCYDNGVAYCPDDAQGVVTCLHEIRHGLFGGFHK